MCDSYRHLAEFVGPQSEERVTIESNEWPASVWEMVLACEEIPKNTISEWDLFSALLRLVLKMSMVYLCIFVIIILNCI